jgi:ABC-type glutathione transport system ATPase component
MPHHVLALGSSGAGAVLNWCTDEMSSNAHAAATASALASSAPVVFDVRDLTKIYRTGEVEVFALRGANAQLHEGEISVLLGPSGSGKSTFLNILGGLDQPTSGTVLFDGQDLSGFSVTN